MAAFYRVQRVLFLEGNGAIFIEECVCSFSADDFIDVILANRVYLKCVYVSASGHIHTDHTIASICTCRPIHLNKSLLSK